MKKSKRNFNSQHHNKAKEVMNRLQSANYFKYTPLKDLDYHKQMLLEFFIKHNTFLTPIQSKNTEADFSKNKSWLSLDQRYYYGDMEAIVEGEIVLIINSMKKFLSNEGVHIDSLSDDFHEGSGKYYNIFINQEKYLISNSSEINSNSWNLETRRFLEIINKLLLEANSKEKLCMLYGGNEGILVFLNDEIISIEKEFNKGKKELFMSSDF